MSPIKCAYCGVEITGEYDKCPFCGEIISQDISNSTEHENQTNENVLHHAETDSIRKEAETDTEKKEILCSLTNGLKVFLTVVSVMIPGIGQIIGIICAILFMNSENDADKRSFGQALLITDILVFALVCISCFGISAILSSIQTGI